MLVIDRKRSDNARPRTHNWMTWGVVRLFFILIAANLASTLLECGVGACADDPVSCLLLSH